MEKSRVYRKQDEGHYVYEFYIILCSSVYYSTLTPFCLNFLRILIHFTLTTPLVTPPCTTISPTPHLANTSGGTVLNYMYTASPSL